MIDGVNDHCDPKKLYKPASWLAKFRFINQIALSTNVVVSIIGEQGGGKTSFAKLLQHSLDREITSHYLSANKLFDEITFTQQLAADLNCNDKQTIDHLVEVIQAKKTHTLIIIDDAHYLSKSFVEKILISLQKLGNQGYCHFCFIGNKPLLKLLAEFEQAECKDLVHSIELGHFNEKETTEYVLHRLLTQPEFISAERAKQFYQYTDGSIIGINTQMASFFNLGNPSSVQQRAQQNNKNIQRLSLVAGTVVVALGLAFTLKPSQSGLGTTPQVMVEVTKPQPEKILAAESDSMYISAIPSYDLAAVRQFMQPTELRRAELVVFDEDDAFRDESMVVMDKVVVAPKVIAQKAEEKKTPLLAPVAIKPQTIARKPASIPVVSPVDKGAYTVQLIASHTLSEIERFASTHKIEDKVRIRKSLKNGRDWYVLTIGDYIDHDQAQLAISKLPQHLAKHKPWIRKLSNLENVG